MKQTVCLEDIASFSKGEQINGDDLIPDGAFDYLNGGIKPSGKWSDYNVCGNSVTISEGGNSSGYVNFMPLPFWCGAHCYYLFDVKGKSRYLYYALKSQQNRIMKIRSGACMPNIKKSDLGRFSFIFDDDEIEQDKVVSVLERVEIIISTRQQQIAELDELVKSRFIEMFVIGNPYPREALKKYITQVRGVSYKPVDLRTSLTKDSVLLLRANNISEGRLNHDKVQYVSAGKVSKAQLITEGDIIMCGSSGSLEHVGKVALCSKSVEGETFGAFCKLIRAIGALHPEYIAAYFGTEEYRKIIMQLACGSNINNIKTEHIDDLQIPIPDDDAQQQFIVFYRQIDKSKFAVRQALDKTQQLFDSLMQEYFG